MFLDLNHLHCGWLYCVSVYVLVLFSKTIVQDEYHDASDLKVKTLEEIAMRE